MLSWLNVTLEGNIGMVKITLEGHTVPCFNKMKILQIYTLMGHLIFRVCRLGRSILSCLTTTYFTTEAILSISIK